MSQGSYYLAEEIEHCLSITKFGDVIKIGSIVDIESKNFNRLLGKLRMIEEKGVLIESLNEPVLNGKTFSKLQDSIMILKYFNKK